MTPIRSLLAMAVFILSLGIANGLSVSGATAYGWPRLTTSLVQAALCTGLTVTGIWGLARRTGISPAAVGWQRSGLLRDLATGAVVVLIAASLVLGPARAVGLINVTAVDPGAVVLFLLTTVVVATGFEALPEELTFRGFIYGTLRLRWSPLLAGIGATVLFVTAPGLSTVVSSTIEWALAGGPRPYYAVAPAGEDPVVYVIFLTVWSATLLAARLVTGSIWTGVSAHVMMLIVNRLVLSPASGVEVRLSHPDVVLVLPAYVLLAGLFFVLLGRRRRRSARPDTAPELARRA